MECLVIYLRNLPQQDEKKSKDKRELGFSEENKVCFFFCSDFR